MNRFFTSDWHFGHRNIIKYCNRPFKDIEEHDTTILDRLNERVGQDDELYFLGDGFFGDPERYLSRIVCRNIFYILGSHDRQVCHMRDRFRFLGHSYETRFGEQGVYMIHCAPLVWPKSHHGYWALWGHSHGRLGNSREGIFADEYQKATALILSRAKGMDVGVDTHDFYPYSFDEIDSVLSKKMGFLVSRDCDSAS